MKDETRFSVEEAKLDEITECPIEKGAQESRTATVKTIFEKAFARYRLTGAACIGFSGYGAKRRDLLIGITVMLVDPKTKAFVILIDQIMREVGDTPMCNQHMLVHIAVFATRCAAAPNAQEPDRIIAAMPDPPAPKINAALDHQAGHVRG